jgi:hypothetical protein
MRSLHRGQFASISNVEKRLRKSVCRMRAFVVLLVACSAPGSADQIDDYIKARMASSPCLNPDFRRDANLVGRRPPQGRYNAPQEGG